MGSSNFGHFDLNLISINIRRMRDRKFGVDVECVCVCERERARVKKFGLLCNQSEALDSLI